MINLKKTNITAAYNSGILQGKAYRVLKNHLDQSLEHFHISILEWKILGLIFDHEELNIAELASLLSVDPPLITRIVNSLEKKDLVQKTPHLNDKRITVIIMTAKGKKMIPLIEIAVKNSIRSLFSGITPEEFGIYMKVLKAIVSQGEILTVKKQYRIE